MHNDFQDLGFVNNTNIEDVISRTNNRNDFNGLPLVVNYLPNEDFKPSIWVNDQGIVQGLFVDALEEIANCLNLTLTLKMLDDPSDIPAMLKCIQNGCSDTSFGIGFTLQRYEMFDFPLCPFETSLNIWAKRPSRIDLSMKYFLLG